MLTEKIKKVVFDSIDDFNDFNDADFSLEKSEDEVLFGKGGGLDSLSLVNLIVIIEEKIEDELGESITIANDKAMSQTNSPFSTVKSMVNFITMILGAEKNE
jgi:D-alanine--poly(phosphoribitol) ligase subunit 2